MTRYSHSRIGVFEQCRYKYKLQYIDKEKADVPTGIERFRGDMVHRTLEELYRRVGIGKIPTLNELLDHFREIWNNNYSNDILMVKKEITADDHKRTCEQYISDYYNRYERFDQMRIIGLETSDYLKLSENTEYSIRIDKFARIGNTYYVCDYKTDSKMKTQTEADNDKQLTMYAAWVKKEFRDASKVVGLWHMLKFDADVESEMTDERISKTVNDRLSVIKEIEECKEWPHNVTSLCDYCDFKTKCPQFRHETIVKGLTTKKFAEDDGVKLVNELSSIDAEIKQLKDKNKSLDERKASAESSLIEFSQQMDLPVIVGATHKVEVKSETDYDYPASGDERNPSFIELLKKNGIYDDVSTVNAQKLRSMIKSGKELPKEVNEMITTVTKTKISSKKLREKDIRKDDE